MRLGLLLSIGIGPIVFGMLEARGDDLPANVPKSAPVIRTGVPHATRDKPQSKLWYQHSCWRALLPSPQGSAVWKRTAEGWQLEAPLSQSLVGLHGQADVWAGGDDVHAVLAQPDRLTLVTFRYDRDSGAYRLVSSSVCPLEPVSDGGGTETATIARDGVGNLWVAYDRASRVWARRFAGQAGGWSPPVALGEPVSADDICAVAAIPGKCIVIWSDQRHDAVRCTVHLDHDPFDVFQPVETVEQGHHTADDHLNIAVAEDGTMFVATKNSVDLIDHPQLVLRVRRPDGPWQNLPYAPRTARLTPSRPIVMLGGKPERVVLVHTLYTARGASQPSFIGTMMCERGQLNFDTPAGALLSAAKPLNNVTGCKQTLPSDAPWIVLASDPAGNIYEADMRPLHDSAN